MTELREEEKVNRVEIVGDERFRTIQVQYDNLIYRGDQLISSGNFRRVALTPGYINELGGYVRTDLTSYNGEVQGAGDFCWDREAHTAYEAHLRENL